MGTPKLCVAASSLLQATSAYWQSTVINSQNLLFLSTLLVQLVFKLRSHVDKQGNMGFLMRRKVQNIKTTMRFNENRSDAKSCV